MFQIYIANDHAGYNLKLSIAQYIEQSGFSVTDCGCDNNNAVDYSDYANILAKKMKNKSNAFGVLVCGSGIGMNIAANRFSWIRAVCTDNIEALRLSRAHNNCNVLCIGSRFLNDKQVCAMIKTFLSTAFDGERHIKRVDKLSDTYDF